MVKSNSMTEVFLGAIGLDLEPLMQVGGAVTFSGIQTDSLGASEVSIPRITNEEVVALLKTDGYWTTSTGDTYYLVDVLFTDRGTGEVYSETHPVMLDDASAYRLGKSSWQYSEAKHNGVQDITTKNGQTFAGSTLLDDASLAFPDGSGEHDEEHGMPTIGLDLEPLMQVGGAVTFSGIQTDSLGASEVSIPRITNEEVVALLKTDGYWTTSTGDTYYLVDVLFTDRGTGEVYSETHPVMLDDASAYRLGKSSWQYSEAKHNGVQDITTKNGQTFAGSTLLDDASLAFPDGSGEHDEEHGMPTIGLDLEPLMQVGGAVTFSGIQTDSLGASEVSIPRITNEEVVALLKTDGYWTTSTGDTYYLVDVLFTDRGTGEVYSETHPVMLDDASAYRLGKSSWQYSEAKHNGVQDITTKNGQTFAGSTLLDDASLAFPDGSGEHDEEHGMPTIGLDLEPLMQVGGAVTFSGIQTDSLGASEVSIPRITNEEVVALLKTDGYWTTSTGDTYYLVDVLFTDRGTGEVYSETHPVMLDDASAYRLGKSSWQYSEAKHNGVQDITTKNGQTFAGSTLLDDASLAFPDGSGEHDEEHGMPTIGLDLEPLMQVGGAVTFSGIQTDSLGASEVSIPRITNEEVVALLKTDGYWTTSTGDTYYLVDVLFTDRGTGEVYSETHPVMLDDASAYRLGKSSWQYSEAKHNGVQDITTKNGQTFAGSTLLDDASLAFPDGSGEHDEEHGMPTIGLDLEPLMQVGGAVTFSGIQTDSLGASEVSIPRITNEEVVALLKTDGYWTTSTGDTYYLVDVLFTDRGTGEVYSETHPVMLDDASAYRLGKSSWQYSEAKHNGVQDITTKNGQTFAGSTLLDDASLAFPDGSGEHGEEHGMPTIGLDLEPLMQVGGAVTFSGIQTDSLGASEVSIPRITNEEVVALLKTDGYWTTSTGDTYYLVDVLFTDRGTGEVYSETHPVMLDDASAYRLGKSSWQYSEAKHNGVQDITTENGQTFAGSTLLDDASLAFPDGSGEHDEEHGMPTIRPDDTPSIDDESGHDHGTDDTPPAEDGMGDMGGGHTGHEGDDMPGITPPGPDADAQTIATYVIAVRAQGETHMHGDDMAKMNEHKAAMDLVPRDEATHIAVSDGDWFDTATWHNGEIPGDNAKVLIPEGIDVQYGTVSDARLFTVRVDGELDFATSMDSRMVFDTMVVSPTGSLVAGSIVDPVDPAVSVELIVANNGPIDVTWDPMLLSRGIISHGEASIHGAQKDSHEKVIEDPMIGDTSVSFAEIPEGWEVGDTIVIAGTRFEGHKWDHALQASRPYESEDEVRTITAIKDSTVFFEEALTHNHDTPRSDLKTSVANYSRNVSIETEDAQSAEVYERGHVMFMHSDDVDVRYTEFHELGRTDKSELSLQHDDFETAAFDNNVQGRYSLHLHRTGVDDIENPTIVAGNAIWGSPGWGFVHHDSNAILENNATFDTFGAGYVAETGNETGQWNDNIAIYAEGTEWGIAKNTTVLSEDIFDTAKGGHGFWFQGRLIDAVDNVASSVNSGFIYFHRGGDDRLIKLDGEQFKYPDSVFNGEDINIGHSPISGFVGNETFAARDGLHIVKANPNQEHDVWSHLQDFTAWSVISGAHLEYTSHYILENFDLIAKEDSLYSPSNTGIAFGKSSSEIVILDSSIEGFKVGVSLKKIWTFGDFTEDQHDYALINTKISDVDKEFTYFDPELDLIIDREDLPNLDPDLELDPLTQIDGSVEITGTKFDTLGEVAFPGGAEHFEIQNEDIVQILEKDGYWNTTSGETYYLVDIYFTDRITGDVFYETHPVTVDDLTTARLGKESWQYSDAKYNGVQDIETLDGQSSAGSSLLDYAILAKPETYIDDISF